MSVFTVYIFTYDLKTRTLKNLKNTVDFCLPAKSEHVHFGSKIHVYIYFIAHHSNVLPTIL